MSNSRHVNYQKLSPNYSSRKGKKISKITIHHMAGNLSIETCGAIFAKASAGASSNYGVDSNGRIGLYVDEAYRAWTSSNAENDEVAVTIEVANDGGSSTGWHVSDKALEATIKLCLDICQRNDIKSLNYTGDASGNLTMHCFFAATACPGPYLKSKFPYIAKEVNRRLAEAEAKAEAKANASKLKGIVYETQSGAFKSKANAEKQAAAIKAKGYAATIREVGDIFKVMSGGPYKTRAEAVARQKKMQAAGFGTIVTTRVIK